MKENVELLQFNGVAYHGSSGSPLLNSDGEVIGIIHSGLENSSKNVIGTGLGSGRNNISEVLDRALNQYPVNTISEATAEPINEITASATISESSENARTLVNTEPKNDLASLIRELKAYTPPSEVRLGSK